MARPELLGSAPPAGIGPLTPARTRLTPAPALSCEVVTDPAEAERLRPDWSELLERSGRNELTQAPDWLLTWLSVYGRLQGRRLRLVVFRDSGRLVGLAPLLRRRCWYRGILPFRRLEFLASGEREGHGICSNHLNVIAERGAEEAVARGLAAAATAGALGAWDELVLPMMDGDGLMPSLLAAAFRDHGLAAEEVETARAPYIPLPATWDAYLKSLSCTHRRQVTRSLRAFEQWAGGEARLEWATDAAGLEKGKRVLIDLHHSRWNEGEQSGVFRSPSFLEFHDSLMRRLLEHGALEVLWLTVRGEPVAALYGMTWGDKFYAYQTGRRLDVPANVRPGGVILAYAVRRAIEAGRREFDLLADEAPYKLQLAPAVRPLVQVRVVHAGVREIARRLMERCVEAVRPLRRVKVINSPQDG
jgi:CelD/BcsL family acetyltransferase involved in cellulose biosynthesis